MFASKKGAEKTMIECEKFLKNDPGNSWMLTKLGLAALQLGYQKTAIQAFEEIKNSHADNVENLRRLEEAYEAAGDVNAAIATCELILKVKHSDHEASQKLKNLSATQSSQIFQHGAQHGATSIVKASDTHRKFEVERHEIHSVAQRNEAVALEQEKIAQDKTGDPRHLATFYGNVGDLWLRVEPEFDKAEEAYKKARELQPTDYTYVFKMDDLNIMRYTVQLKDLENKLKAAPSDATVKSDHQKLRGQFNQFRMKSFEERVRQRPMDLAVAYTLGSVYYEMQKLDEAIGQFQRTVNDPARRKESLLRLGICFSRKGEFALAAKQFNLGLEESEVMNEMKKTYLYFLGDTLEKMGNKEEAITAYTQLYEADIGFRDVSKKLEALKKG
jgi:tetratricopeptide (TPR) repeat protein